MHPLPTLTRNRGPGHEGLAVLWTPCRRGGPDHTASAATGWQGTKTRSKRSNSPELLADWDPQPGSLEQDPPALQRAEDGWRTFRICGRHGGQGGRGQEGAGERQDVPPAGGPWHLRAENRGPHRTSRKREQTYRVHSSRTVQPKPQMSHGRQTEDSGRWREGRLAGAAAPEGRRVVTSQGRASASCPRLGAGEAGNPEEAEAATDDRPSSHRTRKVVA